MNSIEYYKDLIKDTQAPKIQGIMVYSMPGKGVVNGSRRKLELKPVTAKNGKQTLTGKIEAWGEIGLAVKDTITWIIPPIFMVSKTSH